MRGLALLLLVAAPALATDFGPLVREGITDGPRKGFWLQLRNPYDRAVQFETASLEAADERPAANVSVYPARPMLGSKGSRRLLVVIDGLQPGETRTVRVCAARQPSPREMHYARVCSRLTARRLGTRAG